MRANAVSSCSFWVLSFSSRCLRSSFCASSRAASCSHSVRSSRAYTMPCTVPSRSRMAADEKLMSTSDPSLRRRTARTSRSVSPASARSNNWSNSALPSGGTSLNGWPTVSSAV